MAKPLKDMNAAEVLDRACMLETQGKTKMAEMALSVAIKRDAAEAEDGQCSLPRA